MFQGFEWGKALSTTLIITLLGMAWVLLQALILRLLRGRLQPSTHQMVRKGLGYTGFVVLALVVLDTLGVNLSAALGAAGIVGIAVGFAAQTSISNIISGFFLLSEKTFSPGDVINTGEASGVVISIDLLSIKIRTFDNTYVRIPNETIIKSKLVNVTRFPIRRLDLRLTVAYEEDLDHVFEVLRQIIRDNRFALANPEPFLQIDQWGIWGVELVVGVWFEKTDLLALRNSLMSEFHRGFRQQGIRIPFPPSSFPGGPQ